MANPFFIQIIMLTIFTTLIIKEVHIYLSILSLNAFSQYIVYNLHQDLLSNFLFVMMVRVLLFGVTSYQYRNMGMMDNVITNTTKECSPDGPHTPGTRNNYACIFFFGYLYYHLSWTSTDTLYFTTNLERKNNHLTVEPNCTGLMTFYKCILEITRGSQEPVQLTWV